MVGMNRNAGTSFVMCANTPQAAAIGLMYLSTMAGAVDGAALAMYAALLTDSDNSEMIEFLMAGMWILLRNGDNRKVRRRGWGHRRCVRRAQSAGEGLRHQGL